VFVGHEATLSGRYHPRDLFTRIARLFRDAARDRLALEKLQQLRDDAAE